MNDSERNPTVACTLTTDRIEDRAEHVRSVLGDTYSEVRERDDGYTLVFDGSDDSLPAAATFAAAELRCCSFATYAIEVSPPYDETRLTITGPDGTKAIFEGLPDLLSDGELPDDAGGESA